MAFLPASAKTWGGSPTLLDPLQSKLMLVVGSLRKKERDDPLRAWSTLAEHHLKIEQCEQPKKRLASDAGVGLSAAGWGWGPVGGGRRGGGGGDNRPARGGGVYLFFCIYIYIDG